MFPRVYPKMPRGFSSIIRNSVKKGELFDGGQVKRFEHMFSQYLGLKHGIAVGSGRMALYLALKVLGVENGDEVIIPAYTCPVVPSVVLALKAIPVFIDVELNTFNLNSSLIEPMITKRTKVIIATHIEGYPCDIDKVMEIASKYNLKVIEDCAQSIGAEYRGKKVGCFGVLSYFSFATGKQLNTLGGSIILTDDDNLASKLREEIKDYVFPSKKTILLKLTFASFIDILLKPLVFSWTIYPILFMASLFDLDLITLIFEDKGNVQHKIHKFRKKYSNVQAHLGIAHFIELAKENERRRKKAESLESYFLDGVGRRVHSQEIRPIYHYYSILTRRRKYLAKMLLRAGYDSQPTWNRSCVGLKMFADHRRNCPVSSRLEREVLYLPMHEQLGNLNIKNLAKVINKNM